VSTSPAPLPFADLLDILPDAAVVVDARAEIVFANPALHSLLGWEAAEIVGRPLALLVPPAARERHEQLVERYRETGPPKLMGTRPVLHAMHKGGQPVPVSVSLCNLFVDGGRQVSVAVMHAVASMQTPLDRATQLAQTDAVTGVGNRLALSRHIQALLAGSRTFALLRVGVTGLPAAQGQAGRGALDAALRIVARRLQAGLRATDMVARLADDEFALLLDGIDDAALLRAQAERCALRVASPLRAGDDFGARPPILAARIGGALHPRHGRGEEELLAAAHQALAEARRAGEQGGAEAVRLAPG
jgi:PAS domain S-box-containing protein/diguanylate cyclase (GGDEF)-like protein